MKRILPLFGFMVILLGLLTLPALGSQGVAGSGFDQELSDLCASEILDLSGYNVFLAKGGSGNGNGQGLGLNGLGPGPSGPNGPGDNDGDCDGDGDGPGPGPGAGNGGGDGDCDGSGDGPDGP
jgi:hypothetical protein